MRVAAAARRAGQTPHSYMLEAIADKTNQEARRADFEATADDRYINIATTGQTISWNEMRRYMLDRAQGNKTTPPVARKTAR